MDYTGFTTELSVQSVDTTRSDYPVDEFGYPKMTQTEDMFFEKGVLVSTNTRTQNT